MTEIGLLQEQTRDFGSQIRLRWGNSFMAVWEGKCHWRQGGVNFGFESAGRFHARRIHRSGRLHANIGETPGENGNVLQRRGRREANNRRGASVED